MLENIRFCFCFGHDLDSKKEKRCMTFSFTERAAKILTDDFLSQITYTSPEENKTKTGIPLEEHENNRDKVFIRKLDDNVYKISTKDIDPLIRCLFKYLPATFVPNDSQKQNPICVVNSESEGE
ncbi:MAG: hypothetical protein GY863_00045 [bacterium]|nr:hypothetical protein [bacterium]